MTRAEALAELGFPTDKYMTRDILKDRFHQKAAQTHPDAGGSTIDFQRTAEAYRVLREYLSQRRCADCGGSGVRVTQFGFFQRRQRCKKCDGRGKG